MKNFQNAKHPIRNFQKCTRYFGTCLVLSVNYIFWHEVKLMTFVDWLKIVLGILCIIRSQSWDFVHFQKIIVGFCTLFEVNHGILCIFGRSSWDFVHIWKLFLWFCAFLEVPRWILCIFGSSSWPMRNSQICTILRGTSKNAQNPTRNFQICTKSHEELPKMHSEDPRGI
jgi:hypothetical protein